MNKIQKYNQSLIPSTNKQQVLTDSKKSFQEFLNTFDKFGGNVNEKTVIAINNFISKYDITVAEMEEAIETCHSKYSFFKWSNVLRCIERIDIELHSEDKQPINLEVPGMV